MANRITCNHFKCPPITKHDTRKVESNSVKAQYQEFATGKIPSVRTDIFLKSVVSQEAQETSSGSQTFEVSVQKNMLVNQNTTDRGKVWVQLEYMDILELS